jgi:hypothetical protein
VGGGGACVVALRRCIYLIDEVTCDAKANWKCAERACTATGVRGYAVRVKPYVSGSTAGVLAIIVQSRKVRYRRGGVLFTRFLYTIPTASLCLYLTVVRSTAYTDFYNNTFFCCYNMCFIESIYIAIPEFAKRTSPYKAVNLQPTDYARKVPNT